MARKATTQPAESVATASTAIETSSSPTPATETVTVVVTGPRDGRYRCGRYFADTASAPFAVTADELAQLQADPRLVVTITG